jgi:anti-sigma B factor antagonist
LQFAAVWLLFGPAMLIKPYVLAWRGFCIRPDMGCDGREQIMKFTTSLFHGAFLIALSGELDAVSVRQLEPLMASLPGEHQVILLDLSEVSFIDSTGIGALVFLYKRLQNELCYLRLICGDGQPRDLLMLLRINKSIPCLQKLDEYLLPTGTDAP